jgi:hypothetical protein
MKLNKLCGTHSRLTARLTIGSLALAVPLMAMAEPATESQVTVTRLSPAQAAQLAPFKQGIKSLAAQRAAVDENGKLRPHEHDDGRVDAMVSTTELAKRNNATAAMSVSSAGKTVYHPNGAVGQRFDPEFLNFARASVSKDGKLQAACDEGHDESAATALTTNKEARK